MLQAGIKGKKEITVTLDKTAKAMGSGTMDVFATPAMIALMENTAFESVVRCDVPEKYRKFSKSITAFYEISTCDLYVVSAFNNSYLKPDDYLRLSFGLKFQIF